MERLAIHLALNGALVLTLGIAAGLMVYLDILKRGTSDAWHVVHAGGTSRGIMLIALAAIIRLPVLPFWKLTTMAWLLVFFAWTSMLAMIIRGVTGQRGLGFHGSATNRLVWALYAAGTVAVFPGCILLVHGLLSALWTQL
jgi:hypothetical protein